MSFLLPRGDAGELPTIAIAHVPVDMIGAGQYGARSHPQRSFARRRGIQVRNADEGMSLRDVVGNAVRATRFVSKYHRLIATCAAIAASLGVVSVLLKPPPGVASFEMRLTPKPSENATAQSDENAQYFAAAEMDWKSPELVRRTLTALDSRPPTNDEVAAARERLKFDGIALATYHGAYSDRPATGPRSRVPGPAREGVRRLRGRKGAPGDQRSGRLSQGPALGKRKRALPDGVSTTRLQAESPGRAA